MNLRPNIYYCASMMGDDEIEVRGQSTDKDITRFLMLRVIANIEDGQIYIPNVFKPERITERGVGRTLIAGVLKAARRLGCRLNSLLASIVS